MGHVGAQSLRPQFLSIRRRLYSLRGLGHETGQLVSVVANCSPILLRWELSGSCLVPLGT